MSACSFKPGWFAPGEAEEAAKLKGMTLQDFFRSFLGVDWWQGGADDPTTFVLSPATTRMSPGEEYPGDPKGACVFFVEGRCSIHTAKPAECREYDHTKKPGVARKDIVARWRQHQAQLTELLGHEPIESEYEGGWGFGF